MPSCPRAAAPAALSAPQVARVFGSDAGLVFSPVRAERVRDFEEVLGRLHEALAGSTDEERRRQAAGWKVYRASEPGPAGSVLYVFAMSPAVPGADYGVGKLLQEALPLDEALEVFEQYTGALAGAQSILSLRLTRDFGTPWVPARRR